MPANPIATFDTSKGAFKAELFLDKTPVTASNFIDLAKTGFYDGLHFHRVIEGFMLQFGCPHSRNPKSSLAGTGGPPPNSTFTNLATGTTTTRDAREGCVPDEFIDKTSNDVGTLSMANTGQKNSGGSQFFINTVHNDFLDHWRSDLSPSQHPVFGRVVEGMDVVKAIERVQTDGGDTPKTPVTMIKVSIA